MLASTSALEELPDVRLPPLLAAALEPRLPQFLSLAPWAYSEQVWLVWQVWPADASCLNLLTRVPSNTRSPMVKAMGLYLFTLFSAEI